MKVDEHDMNQKNLPILSLIHPDLIPPARPYYTSYHNNHIIPTSNIPILQRPPLSDRNPNHLSLIPPPCIPLPRHRKQIIHTQNRPPLYPNNTDISHKIQPHPKTHSRIRIWSNNWCDCI